MGLGSEIWDTRPGIRKKTYSGSLIQGSKRHRNPDPQHCKIRGFMIRREKEETGPE